MSTSPEFSKDWDDIPSEKPSPLMHWTDDDAFWAWYIHECEKGRQARAFDLIRDRAIQEIMLDLDHDQEEDEPQEGSTSQ